MTASSRTPDDASSPDLPRAFREALASRYTIQEEIGRGGMATVWLAIRRSDGARVALKVLRPTLAQALGARRFLREIEIAALVRAPGLLRLEDSGEIDGVPYYVMPLVDGESLRQRMARSGQLRVEEAIRIARAIAEALGALHREQIVHRDVKPENVLLASDGTVLLADYGIAKAIAASATDRFTSTGMVIGTPAYMSPEQGGGDAVDGRSDLYSLGCLLYAMLTGDPPFHGSTAQAVISRHMHEPPPSIRVVRPAVSPALEALVLKVLGKAPADRFPSAEALVDALEGVELDLAVFERARRWRRVRVATGSVAVTGALAVGGWWYATSRFPLDPERVVVFPFAQLDAATSSDGEQVAMLVGSALERTEPMKWLDGWSLLDDGERSNPKGPSIRRARSLARGERARYFLTGSVLRARDSQRVVVQLNDAKTGGVARETVAGTAAASAGDLALGAVVRLLPRLTGLDRSVDVSGLAGRNPAAIANWLHGEREYRQSRVLAALGFFARAVSDDSLLAPAALRGATAASWSGRTDSALTLVRLALRHDAALSTRQRGFARSLERYLSGHANEALVALRPVLAADAEWVDAWMLDGEIHLHLLPTVALDSQALRAVPAPRAWPLEAVAEEAFARAQSLDPGFYTPVGHLAEIAARRGDAERLARLSRTLAPANPDSVLTWRLALAARCLKDEAKRIDWRAELRRGARRLYIFAALLASAAEPRARACAMAAFSTMLSADTAQGAEDWGALLGFHGMLLASGQDVRAVRAVDSAVAGGLSPALALYVLDASAGVDVGTRADAFVSQLWDKLDTRGTPSLWLLSLWASRERDTTRLKRIGSLLDSRAGGPKGARLDTLISRVAGAYLALARGDSAQALRKFGELEPTAPHGVMEGSLWEALAPERMTLARLQLARGDPAGAIRTASALDHPGELVNQFYLRPSLTLRADAARALGDSALERRARDRLTTLRPTAAP